MTDKMRSFLKGLAMGLAGKPLEFAKEPVAYLYNGVRLPKLPEWDTEVYPYAVIQGTSSQYILTPFSSPATYYDESVGAFFVKSPHLISATYRINKGDEEWSMRSEAEECRASHTNSLFYGYCRNYNPIVWANFDVPNAKGAPYLAKSEPVPVYE